jgi:hypothetical protein
MMTGALNAMMTGSIRRIVNYIAAGAILGSLSVPAAAQADRAQSPTAAAREQQAQVEVSTLDASQTRDDFRELLAKHPPALARVLKLDPSLMTNEGYLATYPALATFLKQHPEVARNPGYFLEFVAVSPGEYRQPSEGARIWEQTMEAFSIFAVFAIIASAVIWLVKTVIEQRRWNRQSKVQTEIHTKLFDRMSSNEDLLAYIQTPAGRRFLEAGPLMPTQAKPVGAPFSRILWSVQAGIVIVAAALGVLFVSGRVIEEVAQPLFAIATIGISLGIGFVVSSAVAYVVSRNMGLIEPGQASGGSTGPESHV